MAVVLIPSSQRIHVKGCIGEGVDDISRFVWMPGPGEDLGLYVFHPGRLDLDHAQPVALASSRLP